MRIRFAILAALLLPRLALADPLVTKSGTSTAGGLKTTITVTVRGLDDYLKNNNITNPKFVLYLQGTPFPNLAVSQPTPGNDDLHFYLDRTATNRDQWAALLRNPVPVREVSLTVGIENGVTFPSEVDSFQLRIYNQTTLYACGACFFVLLALFVWIARQSDILRESGPPPPPPRAGAPIPRRAYSLSRLQMAVWFFVVVASFAAIWVITFGTDSITTSVLALIGISTGTGLAAAVVDGSKAASFRAQRDQLLSEDRDLAATLSAIAAKPLPVAPDDLQKQQVAQDRRAAIATAVAALSKQIDTPAHETFFIDILSDADGISFHRFQMVVWMLILVIVFLIAVWTDLAMPDFSPTLLGLMGISSGTYIGFKFPEAKN